MAKSKFFRVAVEGATTDGRVIERSWISDMAVAYSPDTYGARVNLEHFRGILPDGPFKAYGDVVAAKSEEITDGALKGKLALFVQVEPTPELVALTKAKQKIYPSIEVNPKFADTGRAYLVGLAVTDSPASLGTDMLTFAAQHPEQNPLAARKQDPGNLFTAAVDGVQIEFEEEPADTGAATLLAGIKEKLAKFSAKFKSQDGQLGEVLGALNEMADTLGKFAERDTAITKQFADKVAAVTTRLDSLEAQGNAYTADLAALRNELSSTPANPKRPAASGGDGAQQTNC